jgi:predicted molibdopterin-dependent oxidoreductase YjgC
MPESITLSIDGRSVSVAEGTTVAAAILIAGHTAFRSSITGEPRGALCGMGVCFECRVSINDIPHSRSCQTLCRPGMTVNTG